MIPTPGPQDRKSRFDVSQSFKENPNLDELLRHEFSRLKVSMQYLFSEVYIFILLLLYPLHDTHIEPNIHRYPKATNKQDSPEESPRSDAQITSSRKDSISTRQFKQTEGKLSRTRVVEVRAKPLVDSGNYTWLHIHEREVDTMCNLMARKDPTLPQVPIYAEARFTQMASFDQLRLIGTCCYIMSEV